jgi:CheY-like chemotaxis protein
LPSIDRVPLTMPLFLAGVFGSAPDPSVAGLIHAIRSRRLKVLLIDDNPAFRKSMTFLLVQKYAADVTDVASGPDAVALLKTGNEFNVIFLDLILPDMNGVQIYEEIRRAGFTCRTVVMSAHPDSKEWESAASLNIELVEKPISEQVLISILSEL